MSLAVTKPTLTVGSKSFTEAYVLAELVSQVIERSGEARVDRRFGMGGTGIIYQALKGREIDLYVEYTGTITEAILKLPEGADSDIVLLNEGLKEEGLHALVDLGFSNNYAIAVRRDVADRLGLKNISDLSGQGGIRAGFDHEFMSRRDGYESLRDVYDLRFEDVKVMKQSLIYESIGKQYVDLMDAYTTDAKIDRFDLVILDDDKEFFPRYEPVVLSQLGNLERFPQTMKALGKLKDLIDNDGMRQMNTSAVFHGDSFAKVASDFLANRQSHFGFPQDQDKRVLGFAISQEKRAFIAQIWELTKEHSSLVLVSLLFAILIGIPLGVLARNSRRFEQVIFLVTSVMQTIPSLAFLCFLIPFLGIGQLPAMITLFAYGLLPIIRSTHAGLKGIDSRLVEVSSMLGLSPWQSLWRIDLPLAMPIILSGIKTSAVINVGTATLAAFIGAGGYGDPIVTGLALNDTQYILTGAIPAAVMAIMIHYTFEIVEWRMSNYAS